MQFWLQKNGQHKILKDVSMLYFDFKTGVDQQGGLHLVIILKSKLFTLSNIFQKIYNLYRVFLSVLSE